ncbi:transposase [Nonlabens sp. Asnod3-A02]|uniref:transposase n=1 Tax=Nonlabens sp. Asnod3-A02 TaxID=3160579 RepID=UPI00386F4EC6
MYDKIEGDRYYHIFNQANGMIDIFKESRNYPFFIDKMEYHLTPVCEILAFCLLKDQFHIILKSKEEPESKILDAFNNLHSEYTQSYNKAYNRSGDLFEDSFKRKLIESNELLKNTILHTHHLPIASGTVKHIMSYPWSSYNEIMDDDITFLERDFVLELFNDSANFAAAHEAFKSNPSFIPTFEQQ